MPESKLKYLLPAEFKQAAKDGLPGDAGLRKQYIVEVKAGDSGEEDRILQFTISTGSVDRDGDTINPHGWILDNFKKNGPVLWAHDYTQPPVGKAIRVWVEDNRLKSLAEFTPKDLYPFGYMVYQMYKHGYLNAVSVGFIPRKWEFAKDENRPGGIDFQEQELLEFSAVPVPSQPEALIEARSKGIDVSPMLEWATKVLDGHYGEKGLWVPHKTVEQIYNLLKPQRSFHVGGAPGTAADGDATKAAGVVEKGVVPQDVSRETAPEDTEWSAPTLSDFTDTSWDDLSDDEKRRIARHFAWASEMPPPTFGDLKLPHHRASDGAVVWRGVANAAARLPQTDIPEEDVTRVQDHLASHYRQFGKTPPWEEQKEAWEAYVKVCKRLKEGDADARRKAEALASILFPELQASEKAGEPQDVGALHAVVERVERLEATAQRLVEALEKQNEVKSNAPDGNDGAVDVSSGQERKDGGDEVVLDIADDAQSDEVFIEVDDSLQEDLKQSVKAEVSKLFARLTGRVD